MVVSVVKQTTYPGFRRHPVFECNNGDWVDVSRWMRQHNIKHLTLSWDSFRTSFQVEEHVELFILRWL
jgi:hypothetical protein